MAELDHPRTDEAAHIKNQRDSQHHPPQRLPRQPAADVRPILPLFHRLDRRWHQHRVPADQRKILVRSAFADLMELPLQIEVESVRRLTQRQSFGH